MSRLSQFIWFMNAEKAPTEEEKMFIYTDVDITDELLSMRRKYRAKLRKKKKNALQTMLFI